MSGPEGGAEPTPVLLLEEDPDVGLPIVEQLLADGYAAVLARTAQHAQALSAICAPAILVLGHCDSPGHADSPGHPDALAHGKSPCGALGLLAEIRAGRTPWSEDLPIIFLGSSMRPANVLRAFEAGADDFLARNRRAGDDGVNEGALDLDYLELRARLRSLLRRVSRPAHPPPPRLCVGALRIDTGSRLVGLHGHPIHLRPREYALLLHLAGDPHRVFTKHELLRAVWDFQASPRTRTLDSHACRLRRKLAARSPSERWVLCVRGVGYRLTA
jgi:DNA-binding response OmpR family regulator